MDFVAMLKPADMFQRTYEGLKHTTIAPIANHICVFSVPTRIETKMMKEQWLRHFVFLAYLRGIETCIQAGERELVEVF